MFLGNVFFVSLAITFALLLLLVYHFQQRFTQLERRCDLLYELSTNLVGQVKVMRSSSSTSTTNATATNGIHATATNVLFEPKADDVVTASTFPASSFPASLSKKDEQVIYGEYGSEDDDSEYDDSEEDDEDQDEDDDEDEDQDEDDDEDQDEDDQEKVVELKLGEDPLDVVAHDLLTDIFAQGQGQGPSQGQEGEQDQGQEGQGQGQDEETVVVENPNKNDDTISLRSANVSQLRSQAVHLQLVSMSEAGKMKKKDLQRLLTSSTLSFASAFEVEEVVGEPPAEEV